MFKRGTFHNPAKRLADVLPWAGIVGPGTILNKDGSLMRTVRFIGPDLDSATGEGIDTYSGQLNDTLKRFGSGWAFYLEARRVPVAPVKRQYWPTPAGQAIADEQLPLLNKARERFETYHWLTIQYLPPTDTVSRFKSLFLGENKSSSNYDLILKEFLLKTDQVFDLMDRITNGVTILSDDDLASYLASTVSPDYLAIKAPPTPFFLDAFLPRHPMTPGLHPKLGNASIRVISIRAFPDSSTAAMLDELATLNVPLRWVSRYIPYSRQDAESWFAGVRQKWFNKRNGASGFISEQFFNRASRVENPEALARAEDASQTILELADQVTSYGLFTPVVILIGEDLQHLDQDTRNVVEAIHDKGFATEVETLNATEAWLGSIPGQAYANIRQPIMAAHNMLHMSPLTTQWSGPVSCSLMPDQPPLTETLTASTTPFRLDLFVGDVGHVLIAGPTGSGKSFAASVLETSFTRYPNSRVRIIDKDRSSRCATLCHGGDFFDLGDTSINSLGFQPLRNIHDQDEARWAFEWISSLLAGMLNRELNGDERTEILRAFEAMKGMEASDRDLSTFYTQVQNLALKEALLPFVARPAGGLPRGTYSYLLDRVTDAQPENLWQAFELGALMSKGSQRYASPVLMALFHWLERGFDGNHPTILVIDEGWLFLDDKAFADQIRDWLKTLRKKKVAVIFMTQSINDILSSSIADAVIDSAPTMIMLPNEKADTPEGRKVYERLGYNRRQISLIAKAVKKRDLYYSSPNGNRLFRFATGPVARAIYGATGDADQIVIDRVQESIAGTETTFLEAWLAEKGLSGALTSLEAA
jgi:type IV secretion system protein VirB4